MEVEEQVEASGSNSNGLPDSVINLQSDPEPLPPVDLGSESWHDQVPAVRIKLYRAVVRNRKF